MRCFVVGFAFVLLASGVQAQEDQRSLDQIVVTGTRVADRTALETAVPVDVFPVGVLTGSGRSELNQILAATVPSFNFNQTAVNDGTDIVRPATLRGLQPDQTLVLVNGKRRHQSALVNINGSVGRGSAAVDLNAIPTSAIGSVQVLRDGASAQYGSDAIAGVINILLREADSGGGVSVSYGANVSDPPELSRQVLDGQTLLIDGWAGFAFGEDGFATISGQARDRAPSNRAGPDPRQQYPLTGSGSLDPRELTFDRINHRWGNGNVDDATFFLNAGHSLAGDAEGYIFAGYQQRKGDSPGYYRRALDNRNTPEIYPDGFLPTIVGDVTDLSVGAGVTGQVSEFGYDVSLVYGSNRIDYSVINSLNASLGPSSKTQFNAGVLAFNHLVANLDVTGQFDTISVAVGGEFRRENFSIEAGEEDSYRLGPVAGKPAGSQVFPGFRPESEINRDRNNYALYADVEWEPSDTVLVTAAGRFESYSDFGQTLDGKVSGRIDLTPVFALRGAVSTGFRAPSLQQQFFTAVSTNFIDGVPFEVGTFPATSAGSMALGGRQLQAEKANNYSAGLVFRPGPNWFVTIDGYRIDIRDQIFLTENLQGDEVSRVLAQAGVQASLIRFFQNGIRTRNTGIDIVSRYDMELEDFGQLSVSLAANWNETEVLEVPANEVIPDLVLFSRDNRLTFQNGAPNTKIVLGADWAFRDADIRMSVTRYGDVIDPSNNPDNDFTLEARIIVDMSVDLAISDQFEIGIGADNLFDAYPTPTVASQSFNGIFTYSSRSPFGFSGRYIYGRASYTW